MRSKAVRFLLTLLLACFSATVVSAGDNPYPRPFFGSMTGEGTFDFTSGACLDVTGAPWQSISSLVGNLTHLGLSEYHSTHCSTLDGFHLVGGEATLVAANGDEIWLTYSGELISPFLPPPVVLVYEVHNVVVGGTGRFEGASGEIMILVFVTIEDLSVLSAPVDMEFAGNIIY